MNVSRGDVGEASTVPFPVVDDSVLEQPFEGPTAGSHWRPNKS